MRIGGVVALLLVAGIAYGIWSHNFEPSPPVVTTGIVGQDLPASVQVTTLTQSDLYPLSQEIVGVTVVNFFASWCAPCRAENPVLLQLQAEGVRVIGVAVRDDPDATRQFLDDVGDPFFRVLSDRPGSTLTNLGLGGEVPQTLVVSERGQVLFHHAGPLAGTDGEAALEEIRELAGPR
ncbi:MAG: redoxin family protein [Caulobacterales bacterium]|nr:redoxin family protein [Caulobacterales bacterium]